MNTDCEVDLKLVSIFELHCVELGRVVFELLKHTKPESRYFDLPPEEVNTPAAMATRREFDRLREKIHAKALYDGDDFGRTLTGEVLVWPQHVVPILKHYQRMLATLQTLRGERGMVRITLPDVER